VNAASCLWQNADLPTQTQAKDALTGADNYTVTVKQTAKKAILSWDSFNVGAQTTLNFDQSQGAQKDGLNDWVALNRVSANASPSQIMGKIKADGSIYLINPNGIVFGAGSQVNVHSLIASSLPMYLSSSAKSLQTHNNDAYLKASNQLFLESGISSVGPATANGNLLGLGSGQTQTLADNSDAQGNLLLPSKIEIKSGATISTNKLGFSLIAAPEIHNAGTVSAVDGQIILAAGLGVALKNSADGSLLLNPVLTGSLTQIIDGVTKDATPATTSSNNALLVNQGMVQGIRGDVRLLGASIKQDGIVAATTSVSQAGSITISAQDKQATDATVARTGSLVLTGNSLTTILPDANGETTISTTAATQNFKTGSINLNGAAVTLEKNALVEAPSQKVTITAIAQNDGNIAPDAIRDGSIAGRVYIDEGAIVDVAGIANVELPIESTLVSIPRLGLNELADSPLQKDSPLYGAAVVINSSITGTRDDGIAWVGTPLANLTGYVQQVKRNIEQLLQNGGTITLAGNEVLTQSGSLLNLNSGYISYLGGLLSTTRLVDANGRVVDIANANPNERYTGIAGRFVDRHDRANNSLVYINHLCTRQFF
jgi:filamentous hemagglutinin family protein